MKNTSKRKKRFLKILLSRFFSEKKIAENQTAVTSRGPLFGTIERPPCYQKNLDINLPLFLFFTFRLPWKNFKREFYIENFL